MLVFSGIAVVVVGFALRLNPLLVVLVATFATGFAAGLDPLAVLALLGKSFAANRSILAGWLVLPVVGLLERGGLRERAKAVVGRVGGATASRVLAGYLVVRQVSAALGLLSLGGHAQMVRPIVAPMAEAAEERARGPLAPAARAVIRAHAAAVDNVGAFFGEDVFVAVGSILLMRGFLAQSGIDVDPLRLGLWAIPTGIVAFVVHAARLGLLGRRLRRGGARP